MLYGNLLKTLRKKTCRTSQQIADLIHVSRSTYSRYENNLKEVEDDILLAIANLYGTTVEDFLVWNDYLNKADYPYNIYPMIKKKRL